MGISPQVMINLMKDTKFTGSGCKEAGNVFSRYYGIDFKILPMQGIVLGYYCFFKDEADAMAFKLQWI